MRLPAALVLALAMAAPATAPAADLPPPPAAKKVPKTLVKFGDKRVDNYFWLREKDNPAVIEHLKAENAYTEAATAHLAEFRERLYKEMLSRIKETDESVPYHYHGWWYYTREVEGLQYPIFCRRKGTMEAPEEVMLDVNELAKGRAYTGVDFWEVSPDGNLLAYAADFTGYREYTVHVKDLRTGELLPDRLERVDDIAWAADSATLFYVQQNAAKRPDRLFRHRLGQKKDALVWQEKDELFNLHVGVTRSEQWVVATSASKDTSEVRVIPAAQPEAPPRRVARRKTGHEYYVDHHGADFWIRTNDKGKNFRLVRAPVADSSPAKWRQVLPHRKAVMLEGVDLFRDFWVAEEREDGVVRLRVTSFTTGERHDIEMPESVYSTGAGVNAEYATARFRFVYESYVTPRSVYDYDVQTREKALLKRQPVLGPFDPLDYDTAMLFARAKDGTKVPVSLVWKRSLRAQGPQPLLLYGYGAYGYPLDARFSSARLSLLDRGMVYAVAHVRGGGDRGRLWYDDGKLAKKTNTFTDFVAAAESLVAKGWTAPDRLVIQGGSAGGLLVGAVANLRPDLFRAVVSEVPFVDVLTTMLDATLPLTTGEYIEWGNPNVEREYKWIRAYSPYDNLARKAYPAMLVEASLNDSQVPYWEAAKYVAKLREVKTDPNVVLLKTILEAGHGGASGRYDALRDLAFTYSWILDQVGLAK
jgi:oligopeptidase B